MGELLLASCADKVYLHSLSSNGKLVDEIGHYEGHPGGTTSLTFHSSSKYVITCGEDGTVRLTKRKDLAEVLRLPAPVDQQGGLNALEVTVASKFLATGGDDGIVRLWDLPNKRISREYNAFTRQKITCLSFNAKNTQIAIGGDHGDLAVFNLTTNKKIVTLNTPAEENIGTHQASALRSLHYNHFRKDLVAVCNDSGSVYVWDTLTRTLKASFPKIHAAPATSCRFSPVNRSFLVSVGLDRQICFLDCTRSKLLQSKKGSDALTCLEWFPNGNTFVVGTNTGDLVIYGLRSGIEVYQRVPCHTPNPVHAIRFYTAPPKPSSSPSKSSVASTTSSEASKTRMMEETLTSSSSVSGSSEAPTRPLKNADLFTPAKPIFTSSNSRVEHKKHTAPRPDQMNRHSTTELRSTQFEKIQEEEQSPATIGNSKNLQQPETPPPSQQQQQPEKVAQKQPKQQHEEKQEEEQPSTRKELLKPPSPPTMVTQRSGTSQMFDRGEIDELKNMVFELREQTRTDIRNLQLEMMRQFRLQMNDIEGCINDFTSKFSQLIEDNNRLRAENERLRNLF